MRNRRNEDPHDPSSKPSHHVQACYPKHQELVCLGGELEVREWNYRSHGVIRYDRISKN